MLGVGTAGTELLGTGLSKVLYWLPGSGRARHGVDTLRPGTGTGERPGEPGQALVFLRSDLSGGRTGPLPGGPLPGATLAHGVDHGPTLLGRILDSWQGEGSCHWGPGEAGACPRTVLHFRACS